MEKCGVKVNRLLKVAEGRPNVLDLLINNHIALILNTPSRAIRDRPEWR